MMGYSISKIEVDRRIKAFTTLAISLPASFALAGLLLWRNNMELIAIFFSFLVIVFFLFRLFIVRFFDRFSKSKVSITGQYLERTFFKSNEKISVADIGKITIVRTTSKNIREIRIYYGKRVLVLDGLIEFQKFEEELIKKCPEGIPVHIIDEPIDYDHPLFYVFLGIVVGFASLSFVKAVSSSSLYIINYIVSVFTALIGLYFIFGKPLSKRYGAKSYFSDLAWGALLVLGAASILVIF